MRELVLKELEKSYRSYYDTYRPMLPKDNEIQMQQKLDRWRKMTDSDLLDELIQDSYERGCQDCQD